MYNYKLSKKKKQIGTIETWSLAELNGELISRDTSTTKAHEKFTAKTISNKDEFTNKNSNPQFVMVANAPFDVTAT